nr:hypothetical protein [uncultured Campylobacter sp.]
MRLSVRAATEVKFAFFCEFEFKFDDILNLNLNLMPKLLLPSLPNPHRFGANHGFKTDRNIHGKKK